MVTVKPEVSGRSSNQTIHIYSLQWWRLKTMHTCMHRLFSKSDLRRGIVNCGTLDYVIKYSSMDIHFIIDP